MNNNIMNNLFENASKQKYVGNAKIAAAIVKKNVILTLECNTMKSHPFQKKYGKNEDAIFLHAETHAILKAAKNFGFNELMGADLYIARAKRTGPEAKYVYGLAKPCIGCMRAIAAHGIKNVYYTTNTMTVESL